MSVARDTLAGLSGLASRGHGLFRTASRFVTAPHEYNVIAEGADPTGMDDSLPVFRAIAQDIKTSGRPARIVIPPGTYLFATATTSGGLTWQWAIESDNVEIVWHPGAVITSSVANARVLFIDGASKPAGAGSWDANEYRDATAYALTGTSTKGRNTVTTATAADAGAFAAGDWVQIATGQTITGSNEPDSETNVVSAVDAGTGIVTLRFPLLATYQAENYNSGGSGISSVGGGGSAAPYVIRQVSDRTLHKIKLVNPQITCTTALQAVSIWRCTDVKVEGGNLTYNWLGLGSRDTRFCEVAGLRCEHRNDGQTGSYAIAPSTGCCNWNVHDFTIVSDASSYLHIHEAIKNSRFYKGSVHAALAPSVNDSVLIGVTGRLYDTTIEDINVVCHGASEGNAVQIDNLCTQGGNALRNVRVIAGNAAMNIRCDADGWTGFETCACTNGRISLRAPQLGKGHDTGVRVLSGWVYGTTGAQRLTPSLGVLPRHATPLRVSIYVRTAFDSNGTDLIRLGYSGTTDAYATDTDVSTTGVKTVTAGANLLIPEPTQDRTVVATYANGGSAPATGEAFVALEYALGARRD